MLILVLPRFPDDQLQRLRDAAAGPPPATLEAIRRDDPRFRERLPHAHAVVGSLSRDDFDLATNLRWLQLTSVGAGQHLKRLPDHVQLTTARGAFGHVVAEHALALLLALARDLHRYARTTTWDRSRRRVRSLRGQTLLLLGAGDIAAHVARRAAAFDMRILAVNRTGGDPHEPFHELHPIDRLDNLLPRADALVNALPDTPQTRGLLDARRLALLPPHALLVNVGRGVTIDTDALVRALREKRLGGAGLDVTDPEPLPDDHPLRSLPNALITPHVGGDPNDWESMTTLVADNIARWLADQPLRNLVSRDRGY